ncbi:hypothetical protein B1R32_1093 [Abditibacterium utsteinense]|uniref:Lipoprotein n=1 Tax=Abditibacterium utsteinense TaxID=1960156 RepID=A0A2S8SS72_9BACT|nr:hypothetical protein [Abditibacterium utsteinense]PQV63664.1 hypothetical protein B1R32_1093 [Abditibacterium utsteinense]
MKRNSRTKYSFVAFSSAVAAVALLQGCGGGGSSSPSLPTVPTPYDGAYNATFVPSDKIPADGKAPTGSVNILNGRASLQATFFLQPTVVNFYQKKINDGLTKAGYAGAISDNQIPYSIDFISTGQLDGNGKTILESRQKVDVCGTAILTLDSTFAPNSGTSSSVGNYKITFPDNIFVEVAGTKVKRKDTCDNLPLRLGTVTFAR